MNNNKKQQEFNIQFKVPFNYKLSVNQLCSTSSATCTQMFLLQKFDKLLNRVNIAKADTEDALRRISGNTDELNDSLNTLKGKNSGWCFLFQLKVPNRIESLSSSVGFNHQINSSRAQTDAAIRRLPIINATIQQAVSNNAETQSVLKDISVDYDKALGSINMLQNLVSSLEVKTKHWYIIGPTFAHLKILQGLFSGGQIQTRTLCWHSALGNIEIITISCNSTRWKHPTEGGCRGSEGQGDSGSQRPECWAGHWEEAGGRGRAGERRHTNSD